MPVITPLPTPPSTSDPTNFAERGDAFLGALPQFQEELNEFAENLNNFSTSASSVTSNTVGAGSKAFTVETGKGFLPGQSLIIARTAAPTNRMFAVVDSYNSVTGALVVTSQAFEGSGTFTDWTITLGFNGVIGLGQIPDGLLTSAKLNSDVYASSADIKTGTESAKAISPSQLLAAFGFSAYFQSAEQTITNAGALTIAHGLTRKPILLFAVLVCKTADLNYSVNDELPYNIAGDTTASSYGLSVVPDATNLNVRYGANGMIIPNKTTGSGAAITNSSWRLVLRAWG